MRKMIELTRLDGEALWVNAEQILTIEKPLKGDHADAGARIRFGSFTLLVVEPVQEAIQTIWED